jgi:hypothetical protein
MSNLIETMQLGNHRVPVEIIVGDQWVTLCRFTLGRRMYRFEISKWSSNGFARFFELFHTHRVRDNATYGFCQLTADAAPTNCTSEQRLQCVFQGVRDVFHCIDLIVRAYPGSVFAYAVWYRENKRGESTYAEYITRIACKCIADAEFIDPDFAYKVVYFDQ